MGAGADVCETGEAVFPVLVILLPPQAGRADRAGGTRPLTGTDDLLERGTEFRIREVSGVVVWKLK